jgi:hypothetical protein
MDFVAKLALTYLRRNKGIGSAGGANHHCASRFTGESILRPFGIEIVLQQNQMDFRRTKTLAQTDVISHKPPIRKI